MSPTIPAGALSLMMTKKTNVWIKPVDLSLCLRLNVFYLFSASIFLMKSPSSTPEETGGWQ